MLETIETGHGEKHRCQCRFCKAGRALDTIQERNGGVEDEQMADIRATLNALYEENFERQFALDTIATELGLGSVIGVTSRQVMEQIEKLKDQMAALEEAEAEAIGMLTALRLVPFEYCMISGEHDPTHSARHFCLYQLKGYALKVLFLLHGVDGRNPTNEQLNRVPRIAGEHAAAWLNYPGDDTPQRIADWIERGAQVSAP